MIDQRISNDICCYATDLRQFVFIDERNSKTGSENKSTDSMKKRSLIDKVLDESRLSCTEGYENIKFCARRQRQTVVLVLWASVGSILNDSLKSRLLQKM